MRLALLWMVVMGACSAAPSEPVAQESESQQAPQSEVVALDSAQWYLNKIDSAVATEGDLERARPFLIAASDYIGSDPKRLMQAGLVLMSGSKDQLYGVNYLILLTSKFPEHRFAPEALMQLALYFENTLADTERSTAFLEALIKRHPQHELVPNALALLELNSGGKDKELETVKNWLNKN